MRPPRRSTACAAAVKLSRSPSCARTVVQDEGRKQPECGARRPSARAGAHGSPGGPRAARAAGARASRADRRSPPRMSGSRAASWISVSHPAGAKPAGGRRRSRRRAGSPRAAPPRARRRWPTCRFPRESTAGWRSHGRNDGATRRACRDRSPSTTSSAMPFRIAFRRASSA